VAHGDRAHLSDVPVADGDHRRAPDPERTKGAEGGGLAAAGHHQRQPGWVSLPEYARHFLIALRGSRAWWLPGEVGWDAMNGPSGFTAAEPRADVPEVGVGLLGYAFMGKAHSNALKTLVYMIDPPPARPRLIAIAGRGEQGVAAAATRYGW